MQCSSSVALSICEGDTSYHQGHAWKVPWYYNFEGQLNTLPQRCSGNCQVVRWCQLLLRLSKYILILGSLYRLLHKCSQFLRQGEKWKIPSILWTWNLTFHWQFYTSYVQGAKCHTHWYYPLSSTSTFGSIHKTGGKSNFLPYVLSLCVAYEQETATSDASDCTLEHQKSL